MSTAPPIRVSQLARQFGDLATSIATWLETSSLSESSVPASARALVIELARSVLTELGFNRRHITHEDQMPIRKPDFGFAHAKLTMKDDDVALVDSSVGFERGKEYVLNPKGGQPYQYPYQFPTEADCHDQKPIVQRSKAELDLIPPNTRVVRLQLSADHQIDPKEVVVAALPADRHTAYLFDVQAFALNDNTIDVAVRRINPDMSDPMFMANVHVVLFRVA